MCALYNAIVIDTLDYPEDERSKLLRNTSIWIPTYANGLESTKASRCEPQVWQVFRLKKGITLYKLLS